MYTNMYTKINERKKSKKRVAEKSRTYVRLKVSSQSTLGVWFFTRGR